MKRGPQKYPTAALAYFAGIVDGEGSIFTNITKSKDGRRVNYALRLRVVNTDLAMLEWIVNTFGGYINHRKITANQLQVHTWDMKSSLLSTLLTRILPYLISKRKQAEIAIRFAKATKPEKIELRAALITLNGRKASKRVVHPLEGVVLVE